MSPLRRPARFSTQTQTLELGKRCTTRGLGWSTSFDGTNVNLLLLRVKEVKDDKSRRG